MPATRAVTPFVWSVGITDNNGDYDVDTVLGYLFDDDVYDQASSEVADGPYQIILDQVTNGVAVRMAVLYLLGTMN